MYDDEQPRSEESIHQEAVVRKLYADIRSGEVKVMIGDFNVSGKVARLIEANNFWTEPSEQSASLWLTSGRSIARSVGESIEKKIGTQGLLEMHGIIASLYSKAIASDLVWVWDGIGEWRK